MPRTSTRRRKPVEAPARTVQSMARWKLEDAKARFSEVVRLARTEGPQLVTIRGKEAAVILNTRGIQATPSQAQGTPVVGSLSSGTWLSNLDLERKYDTGREISL